MPQQEIWEKEYDQGLLVSKDENPQSYMKRYFRRFRFLSGKEMNEWDVLDLGSGTGRNANYLASQGANVSAIEIAENALDMAKQRAKDLGVEVNYVHQSIGETYPFPDASFDLVMDITSSNSLTNEEREVYLKEVSRVLKPGGMLMVRALSLENDKNAKNLLKLFPGPEEHTYIMPGTGIMEHVFTRDEFYKLYQRYFTIKKFEKAVTYTPYKGQPYKRQFFFAWMVKKEEE